MRLGKLVALVVIIFLVLQNLGVVQANTKPLKAIYPTALTYFEMFSFSFTLSDYVKKHGMPYNISTWLDKNFDSRTGKKCGTDYFGCRYRGDRRVRQYYLRSCGPDRSCYTEDDLVKDL